MAKGVKNKASKPANNKAMRRISTKLISGIIPVVAIALVVLLAGIAITGRGVINELLTASMQKEALLQIFRMTLYYKALAQI